MAEQGHPHAWSTGGHASHTPGADERALVESYMTRPALTVSADTSVGAALGAMHEFKTHHLLLEDRGRIVAIVSDRDLYRTASPRAGTPSSSRADDATLRRPVHLVATYGLITVPASATIEEAAALMLERNVSALPVTDGGDAILGMLTSRDLLRGLLTCALPRHAAA